MCVCIYIYITIDRRTRRVVPRQLGTSPAACIMTTVITFIIVIVVFIVLL